MARCFCLRRGMTLVELLVAVAIVGLLAVAVLPTLGTATEGRQTREAARMITSFIAQSQARALGQPTWTGFGMVKSGSAAIDLVPARIPDLYRGDTPTASVAGTLNSGTMSLTFNGAINQHVSGTWVTYTAGDLIRFDGRGPWYGNLTPITGSTADCTVRSGSSVVDALAGQTELNTPWPEQSPVTHTFEILRKPQRSGAAMTLGGGRCIDAYWSSCSQPNFDYFGAEPMSWHYPNETIYVLFDSAGRLRQVVSSPCRFTPDGPVLLLVGRVDRAGQQPSTLSPSDDTVGSNWQYSDSMWIAIDRMSGVCKLAECDAAGAAKTPPNNLTSTQQVAWRLRESQNFIRSELVVGNR